MSEVRMSPPTDKTIFKAVSIGMPVFNGEKYIRDALETLLSQSYRDFELIISDNASTDETAVICQQYAARDSRIRYIRQPQNIGVHANFGFVLEQARGKYFMWAAADDKWDATWISDMLIAMKKTGANAAFGKIQSIDEDSQKLNHYANNMNFEYRGPQWFRQLKYFLQFEGVGKTNTIYALWCTADLREIKLNNYQHDYVLVFDLLSKTEIACSSKSRIYKRIHSECEGGGSAYVAYNRSIFAIILLSCKYLASPIPSALIAEYIGSASNNKLSIIAALPFKYLKAYWFIFSNSRYSFVKFYQ